MKEKVIETYLRKEVKKLGGIAYKFVSPGNQGVPDRLVCLPGGAIAFVELKAPGGSASPMQKRQQSMLRRLGMWVEQLNSIEAVDTFINVCRTVAKL